MFTLANISILPYFSCAGVSCDALLRFVVVKFEKVKYQRFINKTLKKPSFIKQTSNLVCLGKEVTICGKTMLSHVFLAISKPG